MNRSLFDQLKDYLGANRKQWQTIALDCQLDPSWIYKFMRGEIKDPGVLRTERILGYARENGWTPERVNPSQKKAKAA